MCDDDHDNVDEQDDDVFVAYNTLNKTRNRKSGNNNQIENHVFDNAVRLVINSNKITTTHRQVDYGTEHKCYQTCFSFSLFPEMDLFKIDHGCQMNPA